MSPFSTLSSIRLENCLPFSSTLKLSFAKSFSLEDSQIFLISSPQNIISNQVCYLILSLTVSREVTLPLEDISYCVAKVFNQPGRWESKFLILFFTILFYGFVPFGLTIWCLRQFSTLFH